MCTDLEESLINLIANVVVILVIWSKTKPPKVDALVQLYDELSKKRPPGPG